ncbi:MAG: hypothetical protein JSV62_07485 [Promethearchaeota archaeon]|nr:MAG: hypothetical protein JSV62_07485 [Candidatus Lokiarchaeota archaeon]
MSIVQREDFIGLKYSCKVCGDKGKIRIFRGDWDDFDEIECKNCTPE